MTFFSKSPSGEPLMFCGLPLFGVLAIIGGFLIQFTMGAFYSFGNIMTYMTSYMRQNGSPNITYGDFVVVQSTWGMTQGVIMPLSGFLIMRIGEKLAMISGTIIFSLGCALTTITINKELWMVSATYGFVSAFGQNIALIPTLTTAMKWFPNNKGTAMGIVVGGFGGGAFVFNQIQTKFINPENFLTENSGPDKGYFTNPILLERMPDLLLLLSGIYAVMGLIGALIIIQPPEDWLKDVTKKEDACDYVTWKEAFKRKELYLLWITRLCVVLITQVIAAFYKAFGQTFIYDDHFLALIGAICSIFNCSGRLFYGFIMDKTSYKTAMSIETTLLTILMATIYCSSLFGSTSIPPKDICEALATLNGTDIPSDLMQNFTSYVGNTTTSTVIDSEFAHNLCSQFETPILAKIAFAVWVWAIFFTFPGTYSTQPAVTTQTFGHKYGGMIYAFIFSCDIINNLMVAVLSKTLKKNFGFLGLFLSVSVWGILAFIATQFYPENPSPKPRLKKKNREQFGMKEI